MAMTLLCAKGIDEPKLGLRREQQHRVAPAERQHPGRAPLTVDLLRQEIERRPARDDVCHSPLQRLLVAERAAGETEPERCEQPLVPAGVPVSRLAVETAGRTRKPAATASTVARTRSEPGRAPGTARRARATSSRASRREPRPRRYVGSGKGSGDRRRIRAPPCPRTARRSRRAGGGRFRRPTARRRSRRRRRRRLRGRHGHARRHRGAPRPSPRPSGHRRRTPRCMRAGRPAAPRGPRSPSAGRSPGRGTEGGSRRPAGSRADVGVQVTVPELLPRRLGAKRTAPVSSS